MECPSALKGPFIALFCGDVLLGMVFERPLSGPNRGCGGYPRLRGFADFALGWWNEPFRLEDGLIRAIPDRESATSKLAR